MIKVKRLASKKVIARGLVVIILVTVALNTYRIVSYIKNWKDAPTVSATIIGIEQEMDDETVSYMILQYSYNGTEYTAKDQMLFFENGKIGKTVEIKCNPDDPLKIYDIKYSRTLIISIDIFVLIVCILFIAALKSDDRKVNSYTDPRYDDIKL